MNLQAIGRRMKAAREERGLTQEQLAEQLGLSTTHISVMERGIKAPRLETFVALANTLGVSADALLFDVVEGASQPSASALWEKIERLPPRERQRVLAVVELLVEG